MWVFPSLLARCSTASSWEVLGVRPRGMGRKGHQVATVTSPRTPERDSSTNLNTESTTMPITVVVIPADDGNDVYAEEAQDLASIITAWRVVSTADADAWVRWVAVASENQQGRDLRLNRRGSAWANGPDGVEMPMEIYGDVAVCGPSDRPGARAELTDCPIDVMRALLDSDKL